MRSALIRNKIITRTLESAYEDFDSVGTQQELGKLYKKLTDEGSKKIAYANWPHWIIVALTANAYFTILRVSGQKPLTFMTVGIFIVFLYFYQYFVKRSRYDVGRLQGLLLDKAFQLKTGFHYENAADRFHWVRQYFSGFGRGNHENYIVNSMVGEIDIGAVRKRALLGHYHWVDEERREESTTDTDGDTKWETKYYYHHFDEYFVAFEVPSALGYVGVWPRSGWFKKKGTYSPSHPGFDKHFIVYSNDTVTASKFLPPAFVEDIVLATHSFIGLSLETNQTNDGSWLMMWIGKNRYPMGIPTSAGINDFADFLSDLTSEKQPQCLVDLEEFAQTMAKRLSFSRLDGNF